MIPAPIALWDGVLQPIFAVLREHTTVDQVEQLRDVAWRTGDTMGPQVAIIDLLARLRREIDRL